MEERAANFVVHQAEIIKQGLSGDSNSAKNQNPIGLVSRRRGNVSNLSAIRGGMLSTATNGTHAVVICWTTEGPLRHLPADLRALVEAA